MISFCEIHVLSSLLIDTWYVLKSGRDKDGCGRTPGSACSTLLYLLQQVNRTHLPPSTGIKISTDKCLNIDQQTAVSTNLFHCLSTQIGWKISWSLFLYANQRHITTSKWHRLIRETCIVIWLVASFFFSKIDFR